MITKDHIEDPKLSPLLDINSVITLQFFILEVNNKKDLVKHYQILYGWCIKSTRLDIDNAIYCGSSLDIHSNDDITYSIYRVSFYNSPEYVIGLINRLTNCESLKSAATDLGIDTTQLKFDVKFIKDSNHKKAFAIRPLIYNETNTLISRNFYEKYSLNSPYKNVPSVSLIINNLDKVSLLKNEANEFYSDWQIALLKIFDSLKTETTLPFDSSGVNRFGNIELINTQCSNEFEIHNVWFEQLKSIVKVNHKDVSFCNKVSVTILANIYTSGKKLLVNCFLTNGGQVIHDECKESFHEQDKQFTIEFECNEPITQISISVWLEENKSYNIWYKHSVPLVRTIATNMGMVGASGILRSEWLTTIQNSNKKTAQAVNKAEQISKTSYSQMTMGDFVLDPWTSADRTFTEIVNQINPPKSEAQFFPKGWDDTTAEHGAISFLEWFKKITEQAQKVVIQDPFFDTLGLEFIARSPNSNTEFKILTCTQVASNDDTASVTVEPNRAARIKRFIESNPSVLNSVKLDIYDLRSTGGGDKNLLHDRYMFIFKNDILVKGFHLSNSIQGASKYSPLLITPIPSDVLNKVNQHIEDTISQTIIGTETTIIPLVEKKSPIASPVHEKDKPANPIFYQELKDRIPSNTEITSVNISFIIDKLITANDKDFLVLWSTIGYFLANSNFSHELLTEMNKGFTPLLSQKLSVFLKATITEPPPIGFSNTIAYYRNSYHSFYEDDFEKSLENSLWYSGHFGESESFSNWGAYYASKALFKGDFEEFIKLIPFLSQKFDEKRGTDLSKSPIPKLNTIIFTRIIEKFFWYKDLAIIEIVMKHNVTCLHAIATASLIANSVDREPKLKVEKAIELISLYLPFNKALYALCKMLLEHKKNNQNINESTEKKCINSITKILSDNYSEESLKIVFDTLIGSGYPAIDKILLENTFKSLVDAGNIHSDKIFEFWSTRFMAILKKIENNNNYSGIIDITGYSLCFVSKKQRNTFVLAMEKQYKNDANEIRKPFKKNSTFWDMAFNRLHLIQSGLAISLLYNDKSTSKIDDDSKIKSLIEQIELLKKQYEPELFLSEIKVFANQIIEEYKAIQA